MNLSEFAEKVGIPVKSLCKKLAEAGIDDKKEEDQITNEEKRALLEFLRKKNGKEGIGEPEKILIKKRTTSEIRIPINSQLRSKVRFKSVHVESRKQYTYARRDTLLKELEKPEETAETLSNVELSSQDYEVLVEAQPESLLPESVEKNPFTPLVERPEEVSTVENKKQAKDKKTSSTPKGETPPGQAPKVAKGKVTKSSEPSVKQEELHVASEKSGRRKRKSIRSKPTFTDTIREHGFQKPTAPIVREVEIPETISVADLAQRMSIKASDMMKAMMNIGNMVTINQNLDQETATIVVEEMGHKAKLIRENALEEEIIRSSKQAPADKVSRPPVVTIMGHVDHGKTSLLDYIRQSQITADEAGGITQSIGAYRAQTKEGELTFLDTPGHEAFTKMRMQGASITDIVVIVVAADDGVMPQTEEAVKHAKLSAVPMIVAVNKIDKHGADIDRIKQSLSKLNVLPEDWGGDVIFVPLSAKTGEGVDKLLEGILLQASIMELKATNTGSATGTVIDSKLDRGRGPIASILVKSGELKKGDIVLSGAEFGRIRAMIGDDGKELEKAGPSTPVEILGLSGTPNAGEELLVVDDEKKAREIASLREGRSREVRIARQHSAKTDAVISKMIEEEGVVTLNLLVKADGHGSVEAVITALERLSNEESKINIISSGVGGITESDINLALASESTVIGFNVRADALARKLVDTEKVPLHYFNVIYDVVDDIKGIMLSMQAPKFREEIIGIAEVREVFQVSNMGDIAGCLVTNGMIRRRSPIRVLRDNVVIYEGQLESLYRFKDAVEEVKSGTECGIGVKGYSDVKVGDQIEVYEKIEIPSSTVSN